MPHREFKTASLEDLSSLHAFHTEADVRYLPAPNKTEVCMLAKSIAPRSHCATAFVLAFLPDRRLVMTQNRRRGLEIPGGHIDPGETAMQAAIREAHEETGAVIEEVLPLGVLRMTSQGDVPDGWRYPHPLGFQQIFMGTVSRMETFAETDECRTPAILSLEEVKAPDSLLRPTQKAWLALAQRVALLGHPLRR